MCNCKKGGGKAASQAVGATVTARLPGGAFSATLDGGGYAVFSDPTRSASPGARVALANVGGAWRAL